MAGPIEAPKVFPWEGKTITQLKTTFTQPEALRFFYAIRLREATDLTPEAVIGTRKIGGILNRKKVTDLSPSSLIDQWRLNRLFEAYWNSNPGSLGQSLEELRKKDLAVQFTDKSIPDWKKELNQIFEDRSFFEYMDVWRTSRRNILKRKSKDVSESIPVLVPAPNWSEEQTANFQARYKRLVETFVPFIWVEAERRAFARGLDREELVGNSLLYLSTAAVNFNWNTYLIAPEWTIKSFALVALGSIWDKSSRAYSPRKLEVPEIHAASNRISDITQARALANITREDVEQLIETGLSSPTDRKIVRSLVFDGLTVNQAIRELRVSVDEVNQAKVKFSTIAAPYFERTPLSPEQLVQKRVNQFDASYFEQYLADPAYFEKELGRRGPDLSEHIQKVLAAIVEARQKGQVQDWRSALNYAMEKLPGVEPATIVRSWGKGAKTLLERLPEQARQIGMSRREKQLESQAVQRVLASKELQDEVPKEFLDVWRVRFEEPDKPKSNVEVGKILGQHDTTVMRKVRAGLVWLRTQGLMRNLD